MTSKLYFLFYVCFGCCKSYLFQLILLCINADVVVAPPFVYIEQVKNSLTDRIEVSAQNVWISKGGAFTGEIRLELLLFTFLLLLLF